MTLKLALPKAVTRLLFGRHDLFLLHEKIAVLQGLTKISKCPSFHYCVTNFNSKVHKIVEQLFYYCTKTTKNSGCNSIYCHKQVEVFYSSPGL